MINIAICDDDVYMLDLLTEKIHAFFEKANMQICILPFTSGKKLLDACEKPDIIFLDIQMDNPNGIETAKQLRSNGYSGILIFVTILRDLVYDAFEVQAFDYLTKPLQDKCFAKTMNRLLAAITNDQEKHLLIQKENEFTIIPFDDIIYCEIISRKIYLHLKNNSVVDYYDKIKNLENKLDSRFFKCHRSYLINMQHLKSYKSDEAYMIGGTVIPVSRLRKNEFAASVLQYMKGNKNEFIN